jgi:hypothetical protein
MSERDAETPTPARPPSPPATRRPDRASDQKRSKKGGPRSGSDHPGPGGGRPMPARALDDSGSAEDVPVEEIRILHEDTTWAVRVRGRSGGRAGSTPLLLLGFWVVDEGEADPEDDGTTAPATDAAPEREALVVGTSLVQLGEEGLAGALARSRPPSPPPTGQPAERPARPRRRGRGRR